MAQLRAFATLFVVLLALHSAFSADLTESSPSPAPEVGADSNSQSPISLPPANSPISSPPAPPPSTTVFGSPSPSPIPETSPSPSPSPLLSPPADSDENSTPSPSPSPAPEAYFRAADSIAATTSEEESSGRMSGGKKAGIVIGVFVGAGVVVFAGIIYKKRQENIRRSQYGYATRRGLI